MTPKDIQVNGVGFNTKWVAGFKTAESFVKAKANEHLFADRPNREDLLKQAYETVKSYDNKRVPAGGSENKPEAGNKGSN